MWIDTETDSVENENFKSTAPERTERLKYAIKTFSELFQNGAEVHPALCAPEQANSVFPEMKNQLGIERRTKLLKKM